MDDLPWRLHQHVIRDGDIPLGITSIDLPEDCRCSFGQLIELLVDPMSVIGLVLENQTERILIVHVHSLEELYLRADEERHQVHLLLIGVLAGIGVRRLEGGGIKHAQQEIRHSAHLTLCWCGVLRK